MLRRMTLRRKADPKTGTHTLREPAQSKCMSTFQKSHFIQKFTGKMLCPRLSPERGHTFCASLRNRNALQHFKRPALYGNFKEKCHAPKPRRRLCASLRSRNALQHFTRATLYGNLQEKCCSQNLGPHFVRACAVEMHFNISQEQLYTEIYRKKARDRVSTWSSTGLYTYRKNPSVWTQCLGKKEETMCGYTPSSSGARGRSVEAPRPRLPRLPCWVAHFLESLGHKAGTKWISFEE